MKRQQFLFEHCDTHKKTYLTTNDECDVEIESLTVGNYRRLKLYTPKKYKLVIGFFRYKTEEQLNMEDMIDNVKYVPEEEKIERGRVVLYKVSNYNVLEYIFEQDASIDICLKNGKPLHIDILALEEIIDLPLVLTKKEEKKIFFVKIITVRKIEYGGLFIDDKIYLDRLSKFDKKEKVVSRCVIYNAVRRPIMIDKDNMYITKEKNNSFISILLNKKNDDTFIGFVLQYNELQIINHFEFKDLKKIVPNHKKILKFVV